jgi:hypothetical protein
MRDDYEYLMGGGRWHDDGGFVAQRPRSICWAYLMAARHRRAPSAWRSRGGEEQ